MILMGSLRIFLVHLDGHNPSSVTLCKERFQISMKAGNLIRNCFFAPVFQSYINNPLGLKRVLGAMHIKIIYKGPSRISTPGTP